MILASLVAAICAFASTDCSKKSDSKNCIQNLSQRKVKLGCGAASLFGQTKWQMGREGGRWEMGRARTISSEQSIIKSRKFGPRKLRTVA